MYGGFSASLWYIERNSATEGTTKPGGEYRYTVYCHGIPLSDQNTLSLPFLLGFGGRTLSLLVQKLVATHPPSK